MARVLSQRLQLVAAAADGDAIGRAGRSELVSTSVAWILMGTSSTRWGTHRDSHRGVAWGQGWPEVVARHGDRR
jgi:hypothetical protein